MMNYRDHGPADCAAAVDYAPAPKFSVTYGDNFAGRAAYQALSNLDSARIHLDRAAAAAARAVAFSATDEQLEALKNAARDCERALAVAIAKLCREPVPVFDDVEREAADHRVDLMREAV